MRWQSIFGGVHAVEPRSTDTRLIQKPGYYGHFHLSQRKAHPELSH